MLKRVNLKKKRMRNSKLLVVFIFVFFSCRKQKAAQENTLVGRWEWVSTNKFSYMPETPQSTGKTWTLIFNSDSTFQNAGDYIRQAVPDQSGTFNLNTGALINGLGNGTYVTLRSANMIPLTLKYYFQSNDALVLDSGSSFDAPAFYFVRK